MLMVGRLTMEGEIDGRIVDGDDVIQHPLRDRRMGCTRAKLRAEFSRHADSLHCRFVICDEAGTPLMRFPDHDVYDGFCMMLSPVFIAPYLSEGELMLSEVIDPETLEQTVGEYIQAARKRHRDRQPPTADVPPA